MSCCHKQALINFAPALLQGRKKSVLTCICFWLKAPAGVIARQICSPIQPLECSATKFLATHFSSCVWIVN